MDGPQGQPAEGDGHISRREAYVLVVAFYVGGTLYVAETILTALGRSFLPALWGTGINLAVPVIAGVIKWLNVTPWLTTDLPRLIRKAFGVVGLIGALLLYVPSALPAVALVVRSTPSTPSQGTAGYTAATPGPGCDEGSGRWVNPDPSSAIITCTSGGMRLVDLKDSPHLGRVDFNWPDHPFPHDYTVGVLAVDLSANTCVGIRTRNVNLHGYGIWVCTQGIYAIYKIDEGGNRQRVKTGHLASTTNDNFRLLVAADGSTQRFTIITADNVRTNDLITDSSYSNTSYISLSAYGTGESEGSATFANFAYVPQP
ncbi:MAG TPA: hypothetical protein VGR57_07085 [Ktedonobacterales bacterium]|nr:hypothetical protein [Ktedonobacterales bacterium]